jgi:hypothetical protein
MLAHPVVISVFKKDEYFNPLAVRIRVKFSVSETPTPEVFSIDENLTAAAN